ncbi:hypothetical protein [Corynebacterium cystitidis]|uniref:hypothetical protein n=1 Tax=Corynebacterium cystitidis TaxID=35757 RepID=UPI00211E8282|nr:hypothetical protein [Corynebacterium cystitidis]
MSTDRVVLLHQVIESAWESVTAAVVVVVGVLVAVGAAIPRVVLMVGVAMLVSIPAGLNP